MSNTTISFKSKPIKKHWSRSDEEKRLCELWLKDPLVNPETGHSIERNGPTFNYWKERCAAIGLQKCPTATKVMTWRKCQEWKKHPDINPDTGRKIKRDGKTYKLLQKQCKLIDEKTLSLDGVYYLPDQKGMVPTVQYRETFYVVRRLDDRKVWGPLNKPAKNIKLHYYSDTWDYHYNHYKPIYINRAPPHPPMIYSRKLKRPDPKYAADNFLSLFVEKK